MPIFRWLPVSSPKFMGRLTTNFRALSPAFSLILPIIYSNTSIQSSNPCTPREFGSTTVPFSTITRTCSIKSPLSWAGNKSEPIYISKVLLRYNSTIHQPHTATTLCQVILIFTMCLLLCGKNPTCHKAKAQLNDHIWFANIFNYSIAIFIFNFLHVLHNHSWTEWCTLLLKYKCIYITLITKFTFVS